MANRTCLIQDCENPSRARGWCQKHYDAWYRHGDPLYQRVLRRDQRCSADGCRNSVHARSLCSKHYERLLTNGTTELIANRSKTLTTRSEIIETPGLCELNSCDSKHYSRGLCVAHYERWRRSGNVDEHIPVKKWRSTCEVPECERKHRSKGLCGLHYNRLRATGTTEANPKKLTAGMSVDQKLDHNIVSKKGCLIWVGVTDHQGYGRITIDGRTRMAHRVFWEQLKGPIPGDLEIDHICHTPACVKVSHLRLATRQQNARHRQGAQPTNKSGIRGVSWHPASERWRARVNTNGKIHNLGLFDDPFEAGRVAALKRLELGFPQSDHDRHLIDGTFRYPE